MRVSRRECGLCHIYAFFLGCHICKHGVRSISSRSFSYCSLLGEAVSEIGISSRN